MNVPKKPVLALACLTAALVLTACGSSAAPAGSASGATASGATSGTTPSEAVASAGTVYSWGRSPLAPALKARHRKRPGAPFGIEPTPTAVKGIQGKVVTVSTSNSDSYALTSAGTVWAWGHGSQGELGNGTRTARAAAAVQVDFPAGVKIAKLPDPMPYDGGMAIDTTGTVWGWGNNARQQFCQTGPLTLLRPVKIPLPDVTLAAGALLHTIYDSRGTIYSCGEGSKGQLGNGTTGHSAAPVRVTGLPSGPVAALTSAWGNAGVLTSSGAYYDWGYNAGGQDGDGTTTLRDRPVRVALPSPAKQVSQGGSLAANGQTMALLDNGELWVWGNGRYGQVGDGRTANALLPVQLHEPTGARFVWVNSGGATDYAIDASGRLWAWGENKWGQVGDGKRGAAQTTPAEDSVTLAQVSSTASDIAGLGS